MSTTSVISFLTNTAVYDVNIIVPKLYFEQQQQTEKIEYDVHMQLIRLDPKKEKKSQLGWKKPQIH